MQKFRFILACKPTFFILHTFQNAIYHIINFILFLQKKKKKNEMNNVSVNLHDCYWKHIFLYKFTWPDMNEFWAWLVKMWYFFYYINTNVSALRHKFVRFTLVVNNLKPPWAKTWNALLMVWYDNWIKSYLFNCLYTFYDPPILFSLMDLEQISPINFGTRVLFDVVVLRFKNFA